MTNKVRIEVRATRNGVVEVCAAETHDIETWEDRYDSITELWSRWLDNNYDVDSVSILENDKVVFFTTRTANNCWREIQAHQQEERAQRRAYLISLRQLDAHNDRVRARLSNG